MGRETRNLVTHALGWNSRDFINELLVGVEVLRQTGKVFFDNFFEAFLTKLVRTRPILA